MTKIYNYSVINSGWVFDRVRVVKLDSSCTGAPLLFDNTFAATEIMLELFFDVMKILSKINCHLFDV
jgi:hypothetical protein